MKFKKKKVISVGNSLGVSLSKTELEDEGIFKDDLVDVEITKIVSNNKK